MKSSDSFIKFMLLTLTALLASNFAISQTMWLSPSNSVIRGADVTVYWNNFGSRVNVRIYRAGIQWCYAAIDQPDNSSSVLKTAPPYGCTPEIWEYRSDYVVRIESRSPPYIYRETGLAIQYPSPYVTVYPSAGVQGTIFSQPGSNFTPNNIAILHFIKPDGSEYSPLPQEATDNYGSYSHTYNSITASMFGTYRYYAVDQATGAQSNTASFILYPQTCVFTIASSNPSGGVYVTVSPSDKYGQGSGWTTFTRTYNYNTLVTLTAPSSISGNNFQNWLRDGSFYSSSASIMVMPDFDHQFTAVYVTPPPIVRTLTVNSSNPNSGVFISADPGDNNNHFGGVTTYNLYYNNNTNVQLMAPPIFSGNFFQKWQLDGSNYSSSPIVSFQMDADHTLTAFYENLQFDVIVLPLDPSINESLLMTIHVRVSNHSARRVSDIKIRPLLDIQGLTFDLNSYDMDHDGDIDYMNSGQNITITGRLPVPRIWEGANVSVELYEAEGHPMSVVASKRLSIFSVEGGSDNHCFAVSKDGYVFKNPKFDPKDWKDWLSTIGSPFGLWVGWNIVSQVPGRCFGMSATSAIYYKHPELKPHPNDTYSFSKDNLSVIEPITRYHISQLLTVGLPGLKPAPSAQGLTTDIIHLLKDANTPFVMSCGSIGEGHAVTGYKLIVDESSDEALLFVYDNEYPGSIQRATWAKNDSKILYTGLDLKCVSEPHRVLSNEEILSALPHLIANESKTLWEKAKMKFIHGCPTRVLFQDEYGRRIGYEDGSRFLNEIPGADVLSVGLDSVGTDSMFVYELPDNLNYLYKFFGLAEGLLSTELLKPTSDSTAITVSYVNIPLTSTTFVTGMIDTNENFDAYVDKNGDGVTDSIIAPTVTNVPPFSFDLVSPTPGELLLSAHPTFVWNRSIDLNGDSVFYKVFVSRSNQFSNSDSSDAITDTTYNLPYALPTNTQYSWKVKAWDTAGNVSWCTDSSWYFTNGVPTSEPLKLVGLDSFDGKVPLFWKAPSIALQNKTSLKQKGERLSTRIFNEDLLSEIELIENQSKAISGLIGYNIYRSNISGGPYTLIASNISTASYVDSGLTNGVKYYYFVTAIYDTGEGGGSLREVGYPRKISGPGGNKRYIVSPSSIPTPYGIAIIGNDLWFTELNEGRIYHMNKLTGEVINSFMSPDSMPTGLATDGQHLFIGEYMAEKIFKTDMGGSILQEFNLSISDTDYIVIWGVAYSNGYLWASANASVEPIKRLMKIDAITGGILGTFPEPYEVIDSSSIYPRGIAYDPINNTLVQIISYIPAARGSYIYEFNLSTERFTGRKIDLNNDYTPIYDRFWSRCRALAYDSTDRSYWISDTRIGILYEIEPFHEFVPCSHVNFRVDMNNIQPQLSVGDKISIRGSISPLDWYQSITMINSIDNIFNVELPFDSLYVDKELEYKYIIHRDEGSVLWGGEPGRGSIGKHKFYLTRGSLERPIDDFVSNSQIQVQSSWNLISIPMLVMNDSVKSLFPNAVSEAFAYQNNYTSTDQLKIGFGYWLKFAAHQNINIPGFSVLNDTVQVLEGWNMIGSISEPIVASSITSEPPAIVTSNFFGYTSSYVISDTINPGKGYWVKVNQDGQLILSPTTQSLSKTRIKIVPTSEMPPSPPSESTGLIELPKEYRLEQNYPNPFNPITTIKYGLPFSSNVKLKIFNLLGQVVAILKDEEESAGYKQIEWNSSAVASGIYFYRLEATSVTDPSKSFTQVKKMLLLK